MPTATSDVLERLDAFMEECKCTPASPRANAGVRFFHLDCATLPLPRSVVIAFDAPQPLRASHETTIHVHTRCVIKTYNPHTQNTAHAESEQVERLDTWSATLERVGVICASLATSNITHVTVRIAHGGRQRRSTVGAPGYAVESSIVE